MKATALMLTAALTALAACETVTAPAAAEKCSKLRLSSAEYQDCVAKMSTQESELEGSKNLR